MLTISHRTAYSHNPLTHQFGWNAPTEDERNKTWERIRQMQGTPVEFSNAAPLLMEAADDNSPVFFWDAETALLGHLLDTWNQRRVGACVGFGTGREAQDLLLWEIFAGIGDPEKWPGAECAPEAVYGGSRVEIGKQLHGARFSGDGSVGVFAYEFLVKYGYPLRGVYGALDLTKYDENTCRRLGANGLPADLETAARSHSITSAALVTTALEGWAAIGGGKPVPVCSDQGFQMYRNADGSCSPNPRDPWPHCMGTRGRAMILKTRDRIESARRCIIIGNSWADYLGSANNVFQYIDANGQVATKTLPPGHFVAELDVWGSMLAAKDSAALAGLNGWKATKINHNPLAQ